MLVGHDHFVIAAEINPPELPDTDHLGLGGAWDHVLVTDNVFGRIRVSPYSFAARITHDVPTVAPTVVVSTRDRNILAIESEVRGALLNGVQSFLVVTGDTVPAVDHLAHHFEVVQHLRRLRERVGVAFEIGMPTRFKRWMLRQRTELGPDFFVVGPVIDPATLDEQLADLGWEPGGPDLHLLVLPPFSRSWAERAEGYGAVPASESLKARLEDIADTRAFAWEVCGELVGAAQRAGLGGAILTGLKPSTVVGEGAAWRRSL